ncbi:VirD4-like conjugal transfer protein, CD1115 family [Macrococcoides canis]|uniref:VirD4-like conjugal transfer protein, CD1115 family n=2 Tax=Macrococcoides canis TaxID=1855823 RepID=UPI001061CCCF|nr:MULTISPECIES: type IV secretory system conjugative DNA transfer family protein [Macrococcus]TDM29298.1 hypothetical protein ETI03_10775 [Macrococcus canis]TDM32010.1 hypothetical protein ETI13_10810 [Macrococcus canis]TDM38927.1 hypothetical protein ETI10_12675 [Macrococcus goetzii]TDM39904.1 hypothetical protein ETI09_10455 [Macrococcus canis]TDM41125.1 hypothetical protein ETI08_12240 [Macrococcus goetzii]
MKIYLSKYYKKLGDKMLDNILIATNKQKPIEKQIIKSERKPFKIKELLADRKIMYTFSIIVFFITAVISNLIVNYFSGIKDNFVRLIPKNKDVDIWQKIDMIISYNTQFFTNHVNSLEKFKLLMISPTQHLLYWAILFIIFSYLFQNKIFGFYKKYRKMNYGQKGTSRFATVRELKRQYKSVPQQTLEYDGDPGVPMTHINDLPALLKMRGFNKFFYNGKFLIDTDTINVAVIGTSRSGKGESLVFPATDIDTRAKNKPSLVFADPKGELYAGSYETLRKRGYDVEVLNLVNPDDGMSYNMLEIIKQEYIKGDFAQAEQYCVSLTKTLFPGKGSDPFWDNAAASLVNALIFTVIHRALEEGKPERITMRNVVDLLNTLGPETENYLNEDGESINRLDEYIMSLPDGSIAKKQYATSAFAGGNTRSSILTVASTTLQIFTSEKLSKMGSANSVDFTRVGFNKRLRVKFDLKYMYERGVVIYGYGEKDELRANFKVDSLGYMENNFKRTMKPGEIIRIEILGDVFEYIFYREAPGFVKVEIDKYTGDRIYPKTAYLKSVKENTGILETTCFYSEKPIAVFMVVPDYDSSIHVVASIFISQLYTMLARRASESGGKCHQRVKFRLDEFGNFPPIHDMANIMTVCLGRNILFELYVQGYTQLPAKYGKEDADTIKDNCQVHIYIKSTNKETNDEIAAKCGMKTVTSTTRNRNGSMFNTEISETDSIEQVPIIEADLLPKFVQGEQVILRFLKSLDNKKKAMRPEPIYNHNETQTPFRFRYLADDFEPSNQFADFDIPSLHRKLKLSDYRINWKERPEQVTVISTGYIASLEYFDKENKEELMRICKEITNDYELYHALLEVQSEDVISSTIQRILQNKGWSAEEIESPARRITQKLREIKDGNTELRDPLSQQSTIEIAEPTKFISDKYFKENIVNIVTERLEKILPKPVFEELIEMDKKSFEATFNELKQEEKYKELKELEKAIAQARLT